VLSGGIAFMELGLVELIGQLKRELEQLQQSSSHLFTVDGVDLELKFVVERGVDATGTARWVLFAAEAKGHYQNQHVNTINLTLKPITYITKDGKVGINIKAEGPTIYGPSKDGSLSK
jgi:Trypsin-co-occurring domain 2